ncbi:MAG: hypothetical protein MJ138_02525 [Kiritimatiellae bacterium]|nr:hypothetical protein [Kiritimatiellia bacterium]
MTRVAVLAAALFAFAAQAAVPRCAGVLAHALDADAAWTLERFVPGLPAPLVSTGVVSCCAGSGIVWRVESPFFSEVRMLGDAMVFSDEDGVRRKTAKELPQYDRIRRQTDAFLAGDAHAFDGAFDLRACDTADGWTLTLEPAVGAMKRLFAKVELAGGERLESVTLKTADGGESRIRFSGHAQGAHGLWKEARP